MRIGVTGAGGRLGSALVARFSGSADASPEVIGWTRKEFDLDEPAAVAQRISSDRPDLVVHAAAWTDVDGCAREPELAMRRNGDATRMLAEACAEAGASLIVVSTNEVFDGERVDRQGYRPDDAVNPPNAYGRSKLAGEVGASEAYLATTSGSTLTIVRTAWLFGAGKPDFPARIAAVARAAAAEGRTLRLVTDEIGTPTFVVDLADAIARLAAAGSTGVHHVVNDGTASRAEWARDVFERLGLEVSIEETSLDAFPRASRPPRWGVLEATDLPGGPLRPWRDAMADRMTRTEVAR